MDTYNGLPVYRFSIDEFDIEDGISIMSFVRNPAVEKSFLKFSKVELKYSFNEDKRIVTGVAMRANYYILRGKDEVGEDCYIYQTASDVEEVVQKFMKERRTKDVNINHKGEKVDGVYLFESFILTDKHKLDYPEFADVELGSWIVSYKVDNEEVWQQIKEGKLNGFSIEAAGQLKSEDNYINRLSEIYELFKEL